MGTVKSFEDLKVWREARSLSQAIFGCLISNENLNDYALKNQINRSSGSIMDNIAEGFERQGNKEFKQFLAISRGSCGEVKSQLIRAFDRRYLTAEEYQKLINKCTEISKMLNGFIKYLKNSDYKGSKFLKDPSVQYHITSNKNLELKT